MWEACTEAGDAIIRCHSVLVCHRHNFDAQQAAVARAARHRPRLGSICCGGGAPKTAAIKPAASHPRTLHGRPRLEGSNWSPPPTVHFTDGPNDMFPPLARETIAACEELKGEARVEKASLQPAAGGLMRSTTDAAALKAARVSVTSRAAGAARSTGCASGTIVWSSPRCGTPSRPPLRRALHRWPEERRGRPSPTPERRPTGGSCSADPTPQKWC